MTQEQQTQIKLLNQMLVIFYNSYKSANNRYLQDKSSFNYGYKYSKKTTISSLIEQIKYLKRG